MAKCVVCGARAVHSHHLVKRQRIRKRWRTLKRDAGGIAPWVLKDAINDPRLQVDVCLRHHTEEEPVPIPHELDFWIAVLEYSLAPDLPRWLGAKYDAQLLKAAA